MKIITHMSVFKNMVNEKPQINSCRLLDRTVGRLEVDRTVGMGVEGNRTVEMEQVYKTVQQKSIVLISNS